MAFGIKMRCLFCPSSLSELVPKLVSEGERVARRGLFGGISKV